MKYRVLNELFCAALINENFRNTLLNNPIDAINEGYDGHPFTLSESEFDLVVHIRATDLEDFSSQVYEWMKWHERENHSILVSNLVSVVQ
jgi:hypothetical protein